MPYKVRNIWTRFVTHEKIPAVFTPEECVKIVDTYANIEITKADIKHSTGQYRDTDVRWIPGTDAGAAWIFERLERAVLKWNANNFNFDIDECSDLQLGYYGTGQVYHWHADLGGKHLSRRKISSVVMLSPPSDYKGGQLEFFEGEGGIRSFNLLPGDLVLFTSWMKHRVTEVTEGDRRTLVGWWSGPPYR